MDKIENKINGVKEIFRRFNFRDDIEDGLRTLGFKVFFEDSDEKIYFTPNEPHEILVYVNWIGAEFWVYKRVAKINKP